MARVELTNRFVTKSLRSALKEKIVFKGSLSCFVQTLLKSHSRRYRVKFIVRTVLIALQRTS